MSSRGAVIPLPRWWLNQARDLVLKREDGKKRTSAELDELGRQLAKLVHRADPYSRTTLQKFATKPIDDGDSHELVEDTTYELATAIERRWPDKPAPVYVPLSQSESVMMMLVRDNFARERAERAAKPAEPPATIHQLPQKRPENQTTTSTTAANKRRRRG